MARGIRASQAGIEAAKKTLRVKGWTQERLSGLARCSRQPGNYFFAGTLIESRIFQDICRELGLEWGDIAEFEEGDRPSMQSKDIDRLVQEVREKIAASIQKRCGTIRVLDMEQPITIDSIYTNVNILEKLSRNLRKTVEELQTDPDAEDFDRFALGRVKTERIPGLDAVNKHEQLMILGKPGAGKTTFLKWLALQCKEGQLHAGRVPFFVTLKEFAEAEDQPKLLDFMARQLAECQVQNGLEVLQQILWEGRSIILLDGLDEVRASDHNRVLLNIYECSRQFDKNQFIITCRIAAKEYAFEQFTEVEVADFDKDQIANFAQKWFQPTDPVKARKFPEELASHVGLQELATNPLLLTLLCLVYGEQGSFPANRSELYAEGLNVLLKKWDVKRNK
jgi:predicted NACHT family NTPase